MAVTGIDFAYDIGDHFDERRFVATSPQRAASRFRARKTNLIFNDVRLEGSTFTEPEVQTLLDGVTVDAKTPLEVDQVLNLSEAADLMLGRATTGQFPLSKELSDQLHAWIGRGEAVESGHFRGEDAVSGGGAVNVMGRDYQAPEPGPGGRNLADIFAAGVAEVRAIQHPVLRAVTYCAFATRNQFYFDGNKRTSRYMMNGHLIAHGYDGIVTPESRKGDYNRSLAALFMDADARPYIQFTLACYDDPRGARKGMADYTGDGRAG
jgi:Fic family protein